MDVEGWNRWGIDAGYHDAFGWWKASPSTTIEAIATAMGAHPGDAGPPRSPIRFVRAGEAAVVKEPSLLSFEGGGEVHVAESLPPDLDLGYHRLAGLDSGHTTTLVVSPGRCPLPPRPTWGWAVQLYALRSSLSWGIGDLADLRELARWSARDLGAGLVVVNPLHAARPSLPQEASPYFPSSRRFRNPLYLRVEEVPGASDLGDELAPLAAAGRALNHDRQIRRDRVFELKMDALERLWGLFEDASDPAFERWCGDQGPALASYATFCVLVEGHGARWREWPAAYGHPDNAAVARFGHDHARRVRFHAWLQWLLEVQLDAVAGQLPVVEDLAVGVDPDGADAWLWQDVFVAGMTVGAPSDEFNTRGQDWGLPPFDPWRLRSAAYLPFIETVRAALRHGGGLRIDHAMGLFRLFWIPGGAGPAEGAYVRYRSDDLLDIVALEAHRAGAYVVAEDLGTVEEGVRAELGRRHMLSYRLLCFEDDAPSQLPHRALAAVTTHDLPTVAGAWTGSDLAAQRSAGMEPDDTSNAQVRRRLASLAGLDDVNPTVDRVIEAVHAALAQAPALLVTATLDDALAVQERPNMPGTTTEWPSWSIALPCDLESIQADPRPRRLAHLLASRKETDQ